VGSDGFGFANNSGVNHKIPQLGTVEIEDDAWIGSNVTIDRATIGATRIKRGARIDNLAQIGHNVVVGEDTVLRPQVGVAGSSTIGANCDVGERAGIAGHIEIGDDVSVHAFSGITKAIGAGKSVMGTPAQPADNERTLQELLKSLPNFIREFQRLKQKLNSKS
jgi:UDP-3-O-[3-hydroxymyristoyl] glucosamine N-acyltransferase